MAKKVALTAFFSSFLFSQPSFSATADPRDSDNPYGVLEFLHWDHNWNGHYYTPEKAERAVELMKETGVGFIRMDFLWDDVEPAENQWNFEKYDRLVELVSKNGIKILGLLDYNAGWAGENWNSAPNADLYAKYVAAVVKRYKDKVKYWEIWNEPNFETYWTPQDGMKSYTETLKKAYSAVKKEDPTAVVLIGGMAADAGGALQQVYQHGGKNYFDIVNFHPFGSPLDPAALSSVRATYDKVYSVLCENADEKKEIWITETGSPGMPVGKQTQNWWLGPNPDETEQAEWVKKISQEILSWPGVKKVFWAFFRDTPDHFLSGTDFFGLVREDFSRKPSYRVFRELVDAWKAKGKDPASKDNS